MFSKRWTSRSTADCSQQSELLKSVLKTADAVLIGAGAGLSTSAGLTYSGDRFMRYFSDFHEKYGISDMYSGGFFPFPDLEEYWAWWSRHILYNRYDAPVGTPYMDLLTLMQNREYFVLTTNVDHQFQKAGFDKRRLFYTQGDYGLWQCTVPCHAKTYDNESVVRQMINQQQNMKIPHELIPQCPVCGKPMTMNLRCDNTFVEDDGWHRAAERYVEFIKKYQNKRLVLLELGVGNNTPSIIKYPFWRMAAQNPKATYICVNKGQTFCPKEIEKNSICFDMDIGQFLNLCTELIETL